VLTQDGVHAEALTSRDQFLLIPAKLVESGRQKTVKLSIGSNGWATLPEAYNKLQAWLASTASQFKIQDTLERFNFRLNPWSPENWLEIATP
jgi:hypothetical protein